MGADIELMNLFWTSSGIFPGRGEISRFDFEDRVRGAARSGFKGIGLWHTDLEHITCHRTLKDMKAILRDNGMKYLELEFLTDWFLEGQRKSESDGRRDRLLAASEALGATHVKVGDFYNSPCTVEGVAEAFAKLCAEAAKRGARIAFEFMASSMLDNLKDSLAMVEMAGAENGGLALDIVHVENLAISHEEIRKLPLNRIVSVELNDGALPGSPKHDPSRARRFCGEGDFDIKGFIACLRGMGYAGPWAVEVFSEELAALPLRELNDRAFATTMAEFEA